MKRRELLLGAAAIPLMALPVMGGDRVKVSLPKLMRAMEHQESSGNPHAVGPVYRGNASIGILQLHHDFVDECNRIMGMIDGRTQRWTYDERYDVTASRDMVLCWHMYYCVHTGDVSAEGIARRHNGGPRGHLKPETLAHWEKVKARLV